MADLGGNNEEDAVVPGDIPLSFLAEFPLWVLFSIAFVTCLAFFRLNRNSETDRHVELVPRSPVDYPYCICQGTVGRLILCPSPNNCQHLFCTQCLRNFNKRGDNLVCPSCDFLLSPTGWYEYYIRHFWD